MSAVDTGVGVGVDGAVHAVITFQLLGRGRRLPVDVGFTWSPDDPLMVHLTFELGKTWSISRHLLACGIKAQRQVGDGDVSFHPYAPRGFVHMVLNNHSGRADFEVPRREVRDFLTATRKCRPVITPMVALNAWLSGVFPS